MSRTYTEYRVRAVENGAPQVNPAWTNGIPDDYEDAKDWVQHLEAKRGFECVIDWRIVTVEDWKPIPTARIAETSV